MTKKKISKREELQSCIGLNRFGILWDNENFPTLPIGGNRSGDKMLPGVSGSNAMVNII